MNVTAWVASSLQRLFPGSQPPADPSPVILDVARNEHAAFQVGIRSADPRPVGVRVTVSAPDGWRARVRRVGYVPVLHHNTDVPPELQEGAFPGMAPDPLFDDATFLLPGRETHAFWVSLLPSIDSPAGLSEVKIQVEATDCVRHLVCPVVVYDLLIEPRRDFRVSNWLYSDAIFDFHACEPFDASYWRYLAIYFDNLVAHGQDTIYVPLITPPLDGVKRPTQLLRVTAMSADRYEFDWRDVRRYIETARLHGLVYFEWSHLFTQWGVKFAPRVYGGQGADEQFLWDPETPATGPVYAAFLRQLMPEFHAFLAAEGALDRSFFHLSDEPGEAHLDAYRAARGLLREVAPWMSVMDAVSAIDFARHGLTDMPVPKTSHTLDFIRAGISCWTYYCCNPRFAYVQRLLDTPLPQIRMNGWLFYRWPVHGFLHWGYNYWYQSQTRKTIDPYCRQDGGKWPNWAFGDPFMVYPGSDGPIDSIRWEVFAHSLQDYALLQTLGVDRDSDLLAPLESYDRFPRDPDWLTSTKRRLYREAT